MDRRKSSLVSRQHGALRWTWPGGEVSDFRSIGQWRSERLLTSASVGHYRWPLDAVSRPVPTELEVVVTVYAVAIVQVDDHDQFGRYQLAALRTIKDAGGRVIAAGPIHPLEGHATANHSAIIQFPTADAARAWYDGEAYRSAIALRSDASTTLTLSVVPGLEVKS